MLRTSDLHEAGPAYSLPAGVSGGSTQLALEIPWAWAERTYAAAADDNGHGIAPDRTWLEQVSELLR